MLFRKNKRIKLSVFTIILVLSLQACSLQKDQIEPTAYVPVTNGYIEETVLPAADFTEAEWVRSNMQKMLSNESAELYLGKAYDIAVVDKRTGKVWYSNEAIYDEGADALSEEQKKYAYSQLTVDYYRKDNVAATVTSYPECYDGDKKEQVTAEVKDDVLSVKYAFGTDMGSRVIFQVITTETYEELSQLAEAAIEEGKLSNSKWGRMRTSYNLSEDGSYYILNPSVTYIQTDNIEEVCETLGYTRADVEEEEGKIGISADLEATVPNFVITIQYKLDAADLIVTVDISEIYEPSDFYLARVTVLPGFGANTAADDGYMVLAEGGGSVIYNDSVSTKGDILSVPFYGDDIAEGIETSAEKSAHAVFPIFGVKSGESAMLAIVESADAVSGVDLIRANQTYVRNMASPWFHYRVRGTTSAGEEQNSLNYVYSQSVAKQPYVVRYHMLYDTRATYSGMAGFYREYLMATGNLLATEEGSKWYEDITVLGAIKGEKTVAGISLESALAATDYASLQEWIDNTSADALSINYDGLFNGGIDGKAPIKLKAETVLGTEEELKTILNNETIYPAISILSVAEDGNGIRSNTDIIKSIHKTYGFIPSYNLATGEMKEEKLNFLITPMSYEKITLGLIDAYEKYGGETLFVEDAGSLLYSDFNMNRSVSREESKLRLCKSLQLLKDSGLNLKMDGVHVYTLQYADAFSNVETESIKQGFMDAEIPFVGMVLHGAVPYSVTPLNEASNYEMAVLDMIECGANPHWRLIMGDMSVLSNTEYTRYFGASSEYWTEEIEDLHMQLKDFYSAVAKETMTDHTILSNGLVKITYSNGYTAYVNRTSETLTDGTVSVEAKGFCLCSGKEGE